MTLFGNSKKSLLTIVFAVIVLLQTALLVPTDSHALCATVKIQIKQELTLERQAFDAHMRINNGLSHAAIENVKVEVTFADEDGEPVIATNDPDNTEARFFIRLDGMDNIDAVDGSGSVAPETSADIHWLIIPSPGASNGLAEGTLYYVGATLTYTAVGESETIEVTPDYIFVKPMPQLVLDYFLPTDVYGDDPWTSTVELAVPFSLGVRVKNSGHGYARSLTIESAQPEIVDNETGLLIAFTIDGSQVNGLPAENTLMAAFGDVAPNSAAVARWIMSCTLSGRFTEFTADFTHADELGGKLTSLIEENDVRTHFLVRDVLVDAEGRDNILDFLAKDEDVYRVFESDNSETLVTDQSADAAVVQQSGGVRFTAPPTDGFMFARVSVNSSGYIGRTMRSDGKQLKSANVWFSQTREGQGPWRHFLNIFDHNTPGVYDIEFVSPENVPQPPVLMPIPDKIRIEGEQLSFIVEASDPNGTTPALSVERLPVGASFTDRGNGSGIFDWTPGTGQAGRYRVKFVASDGVLEASRQAAMTIRSALDTDGDGMPDAWEMTHFGTLDRDGTGDFDGDGISDLDEYLNGFDPRSAQDVPTVPEIISPVPGEHVDQTAPVLEIANSEDPQNDAVTYTFELYADKTFSDPIAAQADIPAQTTTTAWTVPQTLEDNHFYYWRVKAKDATGFSNWAYGHFFVDTQNDPPTQPAVSYPADGLAVGTRTPVLEINNSRDGDGDPVTYRFEIFADSAMTVPVASAGNLPAGDNASTAWTVADALEDGSWYYWRAVASDNRGASTPGDVSSFRVHTTNAAPTAPVLSAPTMDREIIYPIVDLTVEPAEDADGDDLTYLFECDTSPAFDSQEKRQSEPLSADQETIVWTVTDLRDNTCYYWRVKASDGIAHSRWTTGRFFTNGMNAPPSAAVLKNPGNGAWVNTLSPVYDAHAAVDEDNDVLAYDFEVYADMDLTLPLAYAQTTTPYWIGGTPVDGGRWYYWRCRAVDSHGLPGAWSQTGSFFAKNNGVDIEPQLIFVEPAGDILTNAQGISIRWADSDPDSNASISLYYDTDNSGEDGTLIVENLEEDPDGTADYHTWDISELEGVFYLYAVIADAQNSRSVYCPYAVTIDHTPPQPVAAPAGGTFDDTVTVVLSAGEQAVIHYTTDGTQPTPQSAVYAEPLVFNESTQLRFTALDAAGNQSGIVSETYTRQADELVVSVSTDKGRLLEGVTVTAYTHDGHNTGIRAVTDGQGQAHFNPDDFSDGEYSFRARYLQENFWSQLITLPATVSVPIVIQEATVTLTINIPGGPAANVRVYLFDDAGNYLGVYLTTDENGQVAFDLPVGLVVTFRADLFGYQYWSDAVTVSAGEGNTVPMETGGGRLTVTVQKNQGQPLAGVRVYLFNGDGKDTGQNAGTDESGHVFFDVPEGAYNVRADYLAYPFWSGNIQVDRDTETVINIAHQPVVVTVEQRFQQSSTPVENARVRLYSLEDRYLGQYEETDAGGTAVFDLPQKAYKVRVDYLRTRLWSQAFTWDNPVVRMSAADACITVDGAGSPLEGVRIDVFTTADQYIDRFAVTDADGRACLRLPLAEYKFRADYHNNHFWSDPVALVADQTHEIGIATGGGRFTLTLRADNGSALSGTRCFVFDDLSNYVGLHGTTNADGQAHFDMADGAYRIRADYLGRQYWTDTYLVPDTLAAERTITHTPTRVTVLAAGAPVSGADMYLFTPDMVYQNRYATTDAAGTAQFDLPAGADYQFRANLLGHQFLSDPTTVAETGTTVVTVDTGGGALRVVVGDGNGSALSGIRTYLFSAADMYLDKTQTTGPDGAVIFDVCAGEFKVRIDHGGEQYWTNPIEVSGDTTVPFTLDVE